MKKAILATKIGMTQIFNADGVLVPVTVLEAGPCVVTQIKTVENDGYSAVQVGFGDKKEKVVEKDANGKKSVAHRHGVNKAQMGHFKKAGVSGKRFVREFKFENADEYNLADEIKADIFAEGDKVDVTAISKGKGFQGAIKRLGHGQHLLLAAGHGAGQLLAALLQTGEQLKDLLLVGGDRSEEHTSELQHFAVFKVALQLVVDVHRTHACGCT